MDVLEVIALLSLCLACVKFGYILGKNSAKKKPANKSQDRFCFFLIKFYYIIYAY